MKRGPEGSDCRNASTSAMAHSHLFSLPLTEKSWSGSSGDFAGSGVGSSLDFQDHGQYQPGDDPRHINWQAFARTGDYSLKLYREEVRPVVEIILDVSGSMFSEPEKSLRTLELFYFAFFATEQAAATAKLYLVQSSQWMPVDRREVVSHRWVDNVAAMHSGPASERPVLDHIPFQPRSLRVLVSDCLFTSSPEKTIKALLGSNGRSVILCPFSPSESNPNWDGNFEFIDTEDSTRHLHQINQPVLKQYLQTYQSHFESWKSAALRCRVPFARVPSDKEFPSAIQVEALPAGAIQLV